MVNNFSKNFEKGTSRRGTGRINRIKEIVGYCSPEIELVEIDYDEIDRYPELLEKTVGILLSGSHNNVSEFNRKPTLLESYQDELDLIRTSDKPILAICFGLHLTTYAFKGEKENPVIRNPQSGEVNKIISITKNNSEDWLIPWKNFLVDVYHSDYVHPRDEWLQNHFKIMATSRDGTLEYAHYMRHIKKPIYCIQFHPECQMEHHPYKNRPSKEKVEEARTTGTHIICNFINHIV